MKSFKLKKSHYTDLEKLLKDANLVEGREAYPWLLFVNQKTYNEMRRALMTRGKKQNRWYSNKAIEQAVGFYMLNFAPAVNNAVKDGYAIVLRNK